MAIAHPLQYYPISGDATWIVNANGCIVFWNDAAADQFKYRPEEVIGRICHEVITGCRPDQHAFCPCQGSTKDSTNYSHQPPSCFCLQTRCGDGFERTYLVITHLLNQGRGQEGLLVLHTAHPVGAEVTGRGLQIRLLGPVTVIRSDGTQVDGSNWRRSKVRALLGILALQAGRPVHREQLLEALWSDLDYSAALANLNTTIYHLRRSLSPAVASASPGNRIGYESDHYILRWSASDWLDTIMFEQKIRCARGAATPAEAALHYQEALGIYRGHLLDDVILVCQDDYYLREQERLRGQYLTIMEEYAVLEEERQHNDIAEELYGRILTFDPCHESACHRLMALLLRVGNRTRALSHFVQLSEAMQRDLDTCPGRETVQLYEAARLNDEEFAIKNS